MRQKNGQNFLVDLNIADNIVKAADLKSTDKVIEIGPGKGILTKLIQPKVESLTAVEIDSSLVKTLNSYFSFHQIQNIDVVNIDFMKYEVPGYQLKFISNLPYNVGTAIIQKILPLQNWSQCVFMLQKEVIHRLAAKPGTKDYGYISLFTQYYADTQILFDVAPSCFNPKPKVVSSVIKLINKHPDAPDKLFFDFIKHAFTMRRKTILNCLGTFKNLNKTQANEILKSINFDPMIRPDKISQESFEVLTEKIKKVII